MPFVRNFVVAAPTRLGHTQVGLNLGQALAAAGHRVSYFDYDAMPAQLRFLPRPLRAGNWRQRQLDYVNERVLKFVQKVKPDVFLCVKGVQFRPATIEAIGALGVTTAGYWIDDPLDHERSLVNARSYRHYFTNDLGSVARYRDEGVSRIHHLASAADSASFYPLPERAPITDVAFVGTHSPYRESILAQLQDFDLRVHGPGWRKSGLKKSCVFPEAFGKKTNEIYNRARINLNIHNWFGRGTAMNLRLFEVPAAGGFLLTDWVAEIDAAYADGEHLACWRSAAELRDRIVWYLSHEQERRAIAARGHRHFLSHHSYAARAQQLLSCLDAGD